jgi:hypothetical protein
VCGHGWVVCVCVATGGLCMCVRGHGVGWDEFKTSLRCK